MNKNKIRAKRLFIGLSIIGITSASVGAIVSCSGSTAARGSIIEKKFRTNQSFNLGLKKSLQIPENANIYDAKFNSSAIEIINDYQNQITVGSLQKDFNEVLTEFYEIYEVEANETEIELSKIIVKSLDTETKVFTLEVEYEVENENENREEVKKKLDISWTPNITTLSKGDIENIKKAILGYTSSDTNVDIGDLKELFFGEKDDDEDDDIGIFDRIAKINKSYKDMAQMIAYNLTLKDVFGPIIEHEKPKSNLNDAIARIRKTRTVVDLNTSFKVPSLVLNSQPTALIPDIQPKINFTVNDATAINAINTYIATTPPLFNQPAWELKPSSAQFKTTWDQIFINPYDTSNPDYQAITNLVMLRIYNSPNQGKDFVAYMLLVESWGIGGNYDSIMVTTPFPTPKMITLTKRPINPDALVPVSALDAAMGPFASAQAKQQMFNGLFSASPSISSFDWNSIVLTKVGPGPNKHQVSVSSINPYTIVFAGEPTDLVSNEFNVQPAVNAVIKRKVAPVGGILQSDIDEGTSVGVYPNLPAIKTLYNQLFTSTPELTDLDLISLRLEKTSGKNTVMLRSISPQQLILSGELESNIYTIKDTPTPTSYAIEPKVLTPGDVPQAILEAGTSLTATNADKKALFNYIFIATPLIAEEDWSYLDLYFWEQSQVVSISSYAPQLVGLTGETFSNPINPVTPPAK
ncbi:MAG: hypothetical protein ACRCVI_00860 [Mycoplasmoidaceae bacterium]